MTDISDEKYIGDDFVEDDGTIPTDEERELEGIYDLVLPPGVPHTVIMETIEKFNVEVTTRECAVKTMETDKEKLLVLRGELDEVNNASDYIYQKMSKMYNYKKGE